MLSNLDILQSIWLKGFICLIFSYCIGFFSIKKYINIVKQKKLFQPIRADGPQQHLKSKKNTPTMGGIFIVTSAILASLLFCNLHNQYLWVIMFIMLAFAIIGLVDDLLKVLYQNPHGFPGRYKIILQFVLIGLSLFWLGSINNLHLLAQISLPWQQNIALPLSLYVLFITIVIVGSSNAVNLTDGLDGLVSVPAVINLICLIAMTTVVGNQFLADRFAVLFVSETKEIIPFCYALIGSILAFLTFNHKPAKIFMGDVGSLAIGSTLGLIAIIIKQEIIFFIASLLFVAEAVSVMLQVGSYKLYKKRIFLMAPLHHHFEKLGWSEGRIVKKFWLSSLLFAIIALTIFFN